MSESSSLTYAAFCAEDISLLFALHPVPCPPSSNAVSGVIEQQSGYSLTFEMERHLASTFAFLSGIRHDPNHIPAICIQEHTEPRQLSMLVAVNQTVHTRSTSNGSTSFLKEIKSSFDSLFAQLAEATSKGRCVSEARGTVFASIISMCSQRILRRLRLPEKGGSMAKPSIKTALRNVVSAIHPSKYDGSGAHYTLAASFRDEARDVCLLSDAWSKDRTNDHLAELVRGVHRLSKMQELPKLLAAIPNAAIDPSSRKSLLNVITKTGRYLEVANFLCREAKINPLISTIEVQMVECPKSALKSPCTVQYQPDLQQTLTRIFGKQGKVYLAIIARVMNCSEQKLGKDFAQQTMRSMSEAKIHAEVQLLTYCDLHPRDKPPRIVCSSKDACFLCNAYILVHGKLYTPRQHGRLYPGWRLPLSLESASVQRALNQRLEQQIRTSMETLRSRQQKTIYSFPNESTLASLPASFSGRSSGSHEDAVLGVLEHPGGEVDGSAQNIRAVPQVDPSVPTPLEHSRIKSVVTLSGVDDNVLFWGDSIEMPPNHSQAIAHPKLASLSTKIPIEEKLIQGAPYEYRMMAGASSPALITESLEVQVEPGDRNVLLSVEWLTSAEAESLAQQQITLVDANLLQGEMLQVLDQQACVYLATGEATLRLRFTSTNV